MTASNQNEQSAKLEEYLQLLRLLALELDRAMLAIAENALETLEESVASQEALSDRLHQLAAELKSQARGNTTSLPQLPDENLMHQIRNASDSLQFLNRRYAALIVQSSHSVAMMVSLFSSFQGQLREGSGPRLKIQTWSSRV